MEEAKGTNALQMVRLILDQVSEDIFVNKNITIKLDEYRIMGLLSERGADNVQKCLAKYLHRAIACGDICDQYSADELSLLFLGLIHACLRYGKSQEDYGRMVSNQLKRITNLP